MHDVPQAIPSGDKEAIRGDKGAIRGRTRFSGTTATNEVRNASVPWALPGPSWVLDFAGKSATLAKWPRPDG